MKKLFKQSLYISLTIILLFKITYQTLGQEKFDISTGLGFPELLNTGFRYQLLRQAQLGLSVGFWPEAKNDNYISISGDIFYHFGGYPKFFERPLWYLRFGFSYWRERSQRSAYTERYTYARIGRDFNISNRIGIEFDFGISYGVDDEVISPSAGLELFYRL